MSKEITAEDFETLAQKVSEDSAAVFDSGADVESASTLVRKLGGLLDREISDFQGRRDEGPLPCKKGCSWCCYEIVLATAPEIVAVYDYVEQTFSPEERAAFLLRLQEYEDFMASKRTKPFYFVKAACPFLVNGECSVYPLRPFVCRGRSSNDAEICRMWKEAPGDGGIVQRYIAQYLAYKAVEHGLALGYMGKAASSRHEMGQCLKLLFDNPGMAERVLEGSDAFPLPVPKPKPLLFRGDPTSYSPPRLDNPYYNKAMNDVEMGNVKEADAVFARDSLANVFLRLRMPFMYSSYDEILELRERLSEGLDELERRPAHFQEAIPLVYEHLTAYLPYQGLTVKPLLERQGRILRDRMVLFAYPHLCSPITSKRRPGRFRLGYMSAGLNLNNGCRWALGWLRNHGPEFETYAFNWGEENIGSQWWAQDADHYYCLRGDMQRAAEFVRGLDLDALIFTDVGYRQGDYIYYNMRLARVQCTAWGTPVTSGLPSIDYYLSSDAMEPEDAQEEYSEKLVRLPRSGLCYPRPKAQMPKWEKPKDAEFLPLLAQNLRKWTPQRDPLLKRIFERHGKPLKMVGVLQGEANAILSRRLTKEGIPHEILPPTNQVGYAEYLQSADVSYDPPDWSGGNTTIEALSYGVPVVALPGPYMRGRHSLAFLKLANAEGLIAKDEDDFVDLIFDRDRHREGMRNLDVDALYEDVGVVKALDEFLLSTAESL